jgi:hypothetical protein
MLGFVEKFSCYMTSDPAGDKIEKNELVGACSVYVGGERHVQCFGGEI